ncbi:uncharacterized protein LOC131644054 [Vicia villosa]|uniref:uncharacterized protein LOC131644054 n=1 Tax=Vicia villosa TaxID=3911 RepID=UPI00273BB126|nr:uncharacterized protein LOC131644054 [Vicia villosa]XP_058770428.1 uncharacterized protein LOC131644054 [Vicia villosa]XP_058770429.1 uncharacterized protein LOC131644054 [Vicia villosa]XP_058770430.1 uncharacterized protein LOC131644054 [Vicia villosa]
MGVEGNLAEVDMKEDSACQRWTLSRHAFYDLAHVSPVVFMVMLKECYYYGNCKATVKFRALQEQLCLVLRNDPKPGPATFVVQCLYVSPMFDNQSQGFTHLIISAFRRFMKKSTSITTEEDLLDVKNAAAYLLVDIIRGQIKHDEMIVMKILETFNVKLANVENALCQNKENDDLSCGMAKELIEQYTFELVKSQLYTIAVTLMEHFSISNYGQSFFLEMIKSNQFKAAEKWATFMGKPMLSILVEEFVKRNMLKDAYALIKKNNLKEDFPEVYKRCKESSLKSLAEKGCWDVAEARINNDRQLMEYLVYLAMEAGYMEKVDELCERYSLDRFLNIKELETSIPQGRYLQLEELMIEDIIWVDEVESLLDATCQIEDAKVIGLDCEWKPNYVKGSKPNKVSIMQIASEKKAFILDLIKLHEEVPECLDNCLTRILLSPGILKLGYNFQCDIKQLAHSYEELQCFKNYKRLLDVQKIFKDPHGGLAGLAQKVLGAGLNKTRRNSDWEQRPLTRNQLEYAALDAVVLVHIFRQLPDQGDEWKSCMESHTETTKSKTKKYKKRTKN